MTIRECTNPKLQARGKAIFTRSTSTDAEKDKILQECYQFQRNSTMVVQKTKRDTQIKQYEEWFKNRWNVYDTLT